MMAIPYTVRINPKGATVQEKQDDLVRQLIRQNEQLRIIIEDIYKKLEKSGES